MKLQLKKIQHKASMGSKRKKILKVIGITIASFTALLVLFFAVIIPTGKINDNAVILSVNQEPITWREYYRVLLNHRAETYDYFNKKYEVSDSSNFWTTSFNGEIPLEYIKKEAMDEIVQIKIQQILFKQNGVTDDISFEAFLKSLLVENEKRREAVKKGQTIYGPQQYGENEYFSYIFNNAVIKLKEKLLQKELAVSDEELMTYYESIKDTFYKC